MAEDLAIRRAARALCDAAWTDSHVSLDPNEVRIRLQRDAKTASYMMTPEQCDEFIMSEDSDPALLQLVKDFPITHAYLNTFW